MRTAGQRSIPNNIPNSTHTSRAYWELRAEQVMDRVFRPLDDPSGASAAAAEAQQADSIEVEVTESPPQPHAALLWLCGGITGLALISAGLLALAWSRTSQELRQERTLQLLQAVRELGGTGDRSAEPRSTAPQESGDQAPPPPPSEPWMEQLSELDGSGPGGVAPLQVPLNGPLTTPAPAATAPGLGPPPLPPLPAGAAAGPELVGVVQSPGRGGSAIFRLNGSFANASSGESIGASGWRLLSTSGDSALIERGGVSRRVSIGGGL